MIFACMLGLGLSWIPKRLVWVGLIFLLWSTCGEETTRRGVVHADRPAVTAKAQRHSRQRFAAKKGAEVGRGSAMQQEPEPPPRLWYLPVAGR